MVSTALFSNAGHCTRCGDPFGGNATAYMVRETVVCEVIGTIAITQKGTFPVCDACVKPDEQADATEPINCQGCGQRMRTSAKAVQYPISICSDRCRQRVRRQKRKKSLFYCKNCSATFVPTRTDAKFCSAACRQSAHRERLRANRRAPTRNAYPCAGAQSAA